MARQVKSPRASAAVMLTRGTGAALEVYFVKRSEKLRFFGGSWAFPGGVVDAMDAELVGDAAADGERALMACGLRELFEETGVLGGALAGMELAEREDFRRELGQRGGPTEGAAQRWRELCGEAASNGSLLEGLRPMGKITTPGFRPLRYATLFLHAELPAGEAATILPGELDEGCFLRPADVVDEWKRGERDVVPPVLFILEMLAVELEKGAGLEGFFRAADDAMKAIQAGRLHAAYTSPGVLAAPLLTPTLPPAATTNCYLVGTDRVFVIDPGAYDESERERLFDTLDRWQADGREVAGVLLTHQHGDHVGAVSATCARYGAPLFAHAATLAALDARWCEAGTPSEASTVLEAGVSVRPLGPRPARSVAIDEGFVFDLGASPDGRAGWQLVARHTPGHARGHLVFVDERHRAFIVGDMVSTVSTIVIDPPEGDLAVYLASLERLLELGGDDVEWRLLPAHGPWTSKGAALVRRYLAHRAEREASLLRALERGLRTADELVAFVYADTDERLWPLAKRSLAAGIGKLGQEDRLPIGFA